MVSASGDGVAPSGTTKVSVVRPGRVQVLKPKISRGLKILRADTCLLKVWERLGDALAGTMMTISSLKHKEHLLGSVIVKVSATVAKGNSI
jgi:hypothetical protein